MKTNPPLKAVRTFEAAARLLNFREASLELNVTASAVSHQIKILEAYLQKPLFLRKDRKVSLTEAGQYYYQEITHGLAMIDNATLQLINNENANILKISAAPLFVTRWLMPRLHHFYTRYPQIELNIHPTSLRMNPASTHLDLLIRYTHDYKDSDYTYSVNIFAKHHLTPICNKTIADYWKQTGQLPPGTPLMEDTMSKGHLWRDWFAQYPSPDYLERQTIIQYDNQAQILEPAIGGHGVALATLEMIEDYLDKQILFRLFPQQQIASTLRTVAIYRKDSGKASMVKTFIEWMLSERESEEAIT